MGWLLSPMKLPEVKKLIRCSANALFSSLSDPAQVLSSFLMGEIATAGLLILNVVLEIE